MGHRAAVGPTLVGGGDVAPEIPGTTKLRYGRLIHVRRLILYFKSIGEGNIPYITIRSERDMFL